MGKIDVVFDDRFKPNWVAVHKEKIIAVGDSRSEAYSNARSELARRAQPITW